MLDYSFLTVGITFKATDKLNYVSYWEIVNKYSARGSEFVDIKAIGETRERYKNDLKTFKENNSYYESIQSLTLDEFCTSREIELAWFDNRNIEILTQDDIKQTA